MIDLAAPLGALVLTLLLVVRFIRDARAADRAAAERLEVERRQIVEELAASALEHRWGEQRNLTGVVHAGRYTTTTVDRRTKGERLAGMAAPALEVVAATPLERSDTPASYVLARRLPGPLWRRWYARQLP